MLYPVPTPYGQSRLTPSCLEHTYPSATSAERYSPNRAAKEDLGRGLQALRSHPRGLSKKRRADAICGHTSAPLAPL
jgi:hypothetical protein